MSEAPTKSAARALNAKKYRERRKKAEEDVRLERDQISYVNTQLSHANTYLIEERTQLQQANSQLGQANDQLNNENSQLRQHNIALMELLGNHLDSTCSNEQELRRQYAAFTVALHTSAGCGQEADSETNESRSSGSGK